jgi:undecaprenyl-diphosphatase
MFVALAIGARVDHASLLLRLDRPVTEFVYAHRSLWLTTLFRRASFLGSTAVVLTVGLLLAVAAWRRCRLVAAVVVVATLLRPIVEFGLKLAIARPRPSTSRMVRGIGYSFPSGHMMAAGMLWPLVPVVVSLYAPSRRLWVATAVVCTTVAALVGASRVYLGVHWPTDVLAGALLVGLLLTVLDLELQRIHAGRRCTGQATASR